MNELTRALYHGKQAIECRTRVHLIHAAQKPQCVSEEEYESFVKDNEQHAFIIHCLQECYNLLKVLVSAGKERAACERKVPSIKEMHNDQPETIFKCGLDTDDPNIEDADVTALNIAVEKPIHLEDIDLQYGDIRLRFLCFFLDLIELEDKVVETWKRVKGLEISLVSATVITNFAIKKIRSIDSELSLIYPTHCTASTFMTTLKAFLSPMEYDWVSNHSTFNLLTVILEYYQSCSDELSSCFRNCDWMIREKEQSSHSENGGPLTNGQEDIKRFLGYEIMILVNGLVGLKMEDGDDERFLRRYNLEPGHSPVSEYMGEFISLFETGKVSTSLLFMTICWIRSVQCLENSDQLFLYKTVNLYRSFIRQRHTNYKIHLETYKRIIPFYKVKKSHVFHAFSFRRNDYADSERCMNLDRLHSWNIYRHHPFLVGMNFLEEVFEDHSICGNLLTDHVGFSQSLPLIYRALKREDGKIPFLEEFVDFMEQSYHLRHSPPSTRLPDDPESKDPCLTVSYLLRYNKEPDNSIPKAVVIPKALEKMLWYPRDVSILFSVICDDDLSHLKADSVFSEEGMEELIQVTEKELLNGGYLSVDLFKYFIAFRGFLAYLGRPTEKNNKPSPLKTWFDRDCPKGETNFFGWVEQTFFPFLAKFLKSPVEERSPKDRHLVKSFTQSMIWFFNEKLKDLEIVGEKTFIIPKGMNWQMIYETHFGQSFTMGFQTAYSLAMEKCTDDAVMKSYADLYGDCYAENSPHFKVSVRVENSVRNSLVTILAGEIARSVDEMSYLKIHFDSDLLRSEELSEFMFVCYGYSLYSLIPQWNEGLLLTACQNMSAWAVSLLVGISSPERMRVTDKRTGDSVFHILAKTNNWSLLFELIKHGHLPIALDKDGNRMSYCRNQDNRLYTFYFSDAADRDYLETNFLDNWHERIGKRNDGIRRRKSCSTTNDLAEQTIISNLQKDARADAFSGITK
jgi:hypothetical protein